MKHIPAWYNSNSGIFVKTRGRWYASREEYFKELAVERGKQLEELTNEIRTLTPTQ